MPTTSALQGWTIPVGTDQSDVPNYVALLAAAVEKQVFQGYDSVADRTTKNPAPTKGMVSYRRDAGVFEWFDGNAWTLMVPPAPPGWSGPVFRGAYDATKWVRETSIHQSGVNSDASGLCPAIALPAGTTAILGFTVGGNNGYGLIPRADFGSLTSFVLQTRNAATPFAALANTAIDHYVTVKFQV